MPTLYLISKSKPPTARWEQACLEQPNGDEVITPCRTAVQIQQRSAVIFATRGKHSVSAQNDPHQLCCTYLPAWVMGRELTHRGCVPRGHCGAMACPVYQESGKLCRHRGAAPTPPTAQPSLCSRGFRAGAIYGAGSKHGERDC